MAAARPPPFSAILLFCAFCLPDSAGARASEAAAASFAPEPPLSFQSAEEPLESRVRLTLAAEAEPAFFRILLDAAKAELRRAREESEEAHAVALNDGSAFERWSLEIQDETRLVEARALSLLRRVTAYDGREIRARLETFAFDRGQGRLLTLGDLFGAEEGEDPEEAPAAMALLRAAALERLAPLKAERLRIPEAEARAALEAAWPEDARKPRLFSLAPSDAPGAVGGISLHFGPHDLGAGEEGEYEALIPQEIFRDLLAEDWRDAFAGAPLALTRLQSDEGRSGAIFGLTPGEAVSAPLTLRGEAPRAFFAGAGAVVTLTPEHGGLTIARAVAQPLGETPPSGAVEEGAPFEVVLKAFRETRPGAPLILRISSGADPEDERSPDRMSLRLTAGAATETARDEEPTP
ncbi:hypothetical protein [Neomegalonema sp.]|uniref:hypothetical protein n=1 Tax=Neomegalonema sp. TaxID=2039713 RepID=UPI002619F02A|nr:hypothetical protein [Neomegalonema sp.]MDD2868927.1 hypothetical protein [Neomegalonema sp.]